VSRAFVAILGLAIVAAMAIGGFQLALSDAGDDVTVSNETWTPNAGTYVALNKSNLQHASYDPTVIVRDENDTLQDLGTDYDWNDTQGTVQATAGGGLDGDANASITYGYQVSTEQQREVATALGLLPEIMGFLLPVLGIVILLKLLGGG